MEEKKMKPANNSQFVVTKPDYEAGPDFPVTGRNNPSLTLMSNKLVPGSNYYIELGWIWEIPKPNPCVFEHVHSYDEIVLHLGNDYKNPEDLGAEIEFVIDGKPVTLNTTSGVYIPAGTRHGPLTWKKVTRPHLEIAIMLGNGVYKEGWEGGIGPDAKNKAPKGLTNKSKTTPIDPEKLVSRKPNYEAGPPFKVTGRAIPSMTLISNKQIPGCNTYIEGGWIWDIPLPNPHTFEHSHKFNEIVLHIGDDYTHPEDLGAEIDFVVAGKSHLLKTTSAVYLPAGTKHGPLTWNKTIRPHIEMAMMLGTGDFKEGWEE
jgi:hypothetical protein